MPGITIDQFLAAPEHEIVIVEYQDIFRTEAALKHGKFSKEYQDLSAVILLDPDDLKKIGAGDGGPVKISNEYGTVVVTAKKSEGDTKHDVRANEGHQGHPGVGYMPASVWLNTLGSRPVSAKVSRSQQKISAVSELIPGFKV
ncbi:MAG: molybdopterin dinucleotide binding domain-containing protein [Euryarchaeota archaeon]|nr:molybdopterin dinucleotide binding domain-containing protein [Euryarchaeota archaeon]